MATVTGSWAGSGGARGRLIIVWSSSSTDTSITFDIDVKAEADNSVFDSDNTLTRSGSLFDGGSSSVDLSLSSGQIKTIWSGTKTVSRGASAKSYSMAFSLSGVNYWGETASVSANVTVPAMPAPDTPSSVSITKVDNDTLRVTWSGGTAHHVQVRGRSVNGDGTSSWNDWNTVSAAGASVSSGATFDVAGDRDYQARVRRQNSADVWSDYGTSSNTARLYDAPNAPTAVSTARVNDANHKVTLGGSAASGKPIRWVDIERYNGVTGAWASIATGLAGSTRSYSDTANMWDNTTRHRVRFRNSAGSSAWTYGNTAWTTPAAASKPTAKRSGTSNVIVTWTNNARKAIGIDLRAASSSDGGTTWTGYSPITGHTGLGAAVTSRTVTGLDASKLWKFETRTYVTSPTTLSAYSGGGNVLQLLAAPSAPTLLAPLGTLSDQELVTFSWRHNPVDGSDQTAASLRYRLDGGAWVTLTATTAETITTASPLDAGTLEWQVQTKGSHASYGAWSGVASLLVASPPAVTILTPADGATVTSNRLTLTLGWDDAQDAAMVRRTRRLRDASGEVIEEVSAAGAATTITYTTRLADGETYTAEVEATSGTGLKSGVASATVTVDYIDPVAPILSADWIEEQGQTVIAVTNSPGVEATPVATNLATNSSMEQAGAALEVRRNGFPNPRGVNAANFSPVGGTDGSVSAAYVAEAAPCGVGFRRVTSVTASTTFDQGVVIARNAAGSVPAGTPLVVSFAIRANRDRSIWLPTIHYAGGVPKVQTIPGYFSLIAGVWQRITVTVPLEGAEDGYYMCIYPSGSPDRMKAGDTLDVTEVMEGAGSYFDGAYSPDPDLTPSWTGTANASASILTATRVAGIDVGWQSGQWAADGNRSLRIPDGSVHSISLTDQTLIVTPRAAGQVYLVDGVQRATTGEPVRVTGAAVVGLGPGWWDCLALVDGGWVQGWWDGNNPLPGHASAWLGDGTSMLTTLPTVDTVSNRVERSDDGGDTWVTVAEDVEPDGGLTDWQVPLNTDVQYRAVSISELGAEAIGEPIGVTTTSCLLWLTGPAGDMVAITWDLSLQADHGQQVVLEQYYRRSKPESHYGDARPVALQVSGVLTPGYGHGTDPDVLLGGDVYYRDPERRAYLCAITSPVSLQSTDSEAMSISMTLEAVDAS